MDTSNFVSDRFGRVVKTPGRHGYLTFLPAPLPRSISLDEETVVQLSEADRALGRLAGAGRLLPNPVLLVNAYIRREAVASSRIEGTQATISEVFDAESRGDVRGDVEEVVNYVRAMSAGLAKLETLPISRRLVEEIHGILLSGVRGQERDPGHVRTSPNWIGSPDNRPETAVFVPPPKDEMDAALADWERFVHADLVMPPLVKCALMHYQFETIHPFLDGNGRLGRLLIVFFLVSTGHLPEPLLYVSSFFDRNKYEYYDRLQAVRERGEVQEWIRFFLRAVSEQSTDAIERAERLTDLKQVYRQRLFGSRSRAHEVVECLSENPFITSAQAAKYLNVSGQGAKNLLEQLTDAGILSPVARIPGRAKRWVAYEMLDALSSDPNPA